MFVFREIRMGKTFWSGKFWGKQFREDFLGGWNKGLEKYEIQNHHGMYHMGLKKDNGGMQNVVRYLRGSWKVGDEGIQ